MAFEIDPTKTAAAEVQRIATEELAGALRLLDRPKPKGLEATVHSVRKHCKRVRALVRIVRSEARSDYRRINDAARQASAELSPLRDAHAVLVTFDALVAARPDLIVFEQIHDVRAELATRATSMSPTEAAVQFERASTLLGVAAACVGSWELDVRLGDLIDGMSEYQRLAARAFRRSVKDASDENLHEWRKRSKDHWYHTQLLCQLAPSVLGATEKSLSNLCDALGDNNDLAVLSAALREAPDELGGRQASELIPVIAQVRGELLERCRPLGAVLYAEDHDHYRSRLRRYAKVRRAFGPEQRVRGIDTIFKSDRHARS